MKTLELFLTGMKIFLLGLLKAHVCCQVIWGLSSAGILGSTLQFRSSEIWHLIPVLTTWPIILFTGYSTGCGVAKAVRGKRWPSTILWTNIAFTIAGVAFFPVFIMSAYWPAVQKANLLCGAVVPFIVWPLALYLAFILASMVIKKTTNSQGRVVVSASLLSLATATYWGMGAWFDYMSAVCEPLCHG